VLEFTLVEGQPLKRPHACIICRGNLGGMCDTQHDLPGFGNIYVCETCGKTIAQLFGFARGKRMTQLTQAAATIEQLETDLRTTHEQAQANSTRADEMAQLADGLREELELARQRVGQLEDRFVAQAREQLELVAAGADTSGA
jgi:hypothetical protein